MQQQIILLKFAAKPNS